MMEDLGYKRTDMPEMAISEKDKNKIQYPTLNLYHKVPADIASKDVGDMCRFEIIGKIVGKSEREEGHDITIEIQKMGYKSPAGKKTKDEYLNMDDKEREDYDKEDLNIDEDKE